MKKNIAGKICLLTLLIGFSGNNVASEITESFGNTDSPEVAESLEVGESLGFSESLEVSESPEVTGLAEDPETSIAADVNEKPDVTQLPEINKIPELTQSSVSEQRQKPLNIEGKKILLQRVLARPFSNIYKDNNVDSGVVESNIPALKPFYVYAKPTPEEKELEDGWYQVGTNTRGKIVGWMQAKDVFEWNQTMCLVYTHPEVVNRF